MNAYPDPDDLAAVPRDSRAEGYVLTCLLDFGRDAVDLLPLVRREHFFPGFPYRDIFDAFATLHAVPGQPCRAADVAASLERVGKKGLARDAIALPGEFGTIPPAVARLELDKLEGSRQRRERLGSLESERIALLNLAVPVADTFATTRADLERIVMAGAGPSDRFGGGLLSAAELGTLFIAPRAALLGRWFCEGDLGFLFAQRGVGKTWFSLLLARAVAGGAPAGPWRRGEGMAAPVLYVDGEMPLELLQARTRGLGLDAAGVSFLNHEQLFNATGRLLNLSDPAAQRNLTALCRERAVKLLVLDNLSCLFQGVSENDADAWEMVLPWLLELRRLKIAVLIVAHAGRNNAMRGTSRREDAAAWIIRLDDATAGAGPKNGAKFVSSFVKPSRNTPENIPPLEWTVATDAASGRSSVAYKEAEGEEAVLGWVRNGLNTCADIARELGVSPGTVSKMATRLIQAGKLKKEGRGYALPLLGEEAARPGETS